MPNGKKKNQAATQNRVLDFGLGTLASVLATIICFFAAWIYVQPDQPGNEAIKPLVVGFAVVALLFAPLSWFQYKRSRDAIVDFQTSNDRLKEENQKLTDSKRQVSEDNQKNRDDLQKSKRDNDGLSRLLNSYKLKLDKLAIDLRAAQEEKANLTQINIRLEQDKEVLEGALRRTQRLVTLQSNLQQGMSEVAKVDSAKHETLMSNMLKKALSDASRIFEGCVCRVAIFTPDDKEEWLNCIEKNDDIDKWTVPPGSFYIGKDAKLAKRRGVAGHAYLNASAETQIAHISLKGGVWVSDHHYYHPSKADTLEPNYRSLACAAILDADDMCLGVLCLDSEKIDTFDGDEAIKHFIGHLARCFGKAMDMDRSLALSRSDQTKVEKA